MKQQMTARLWNNDEKHWAECAREKGLFSAIQGVVGKCDGLLPFSRATNNTEGRGKKRGGEKERRASRTAAARPTCKLNQLRSFDRVAGMEERNNLRVSKETLSVMHNGKLGHHKCVRALLK